MSRTRGAGGSFRFSLDTAAFGPNNRSTARSRSFAAAGGSSTEGGISPARSAIRRQPYSGSRAGLEARQAMIGMPLVGQRGLDIAELEGLVEGGRRGLETARKLIGLLRN